MIVTLGGGIGASKLLLGLCQVIDPAELTVIVNTGDDFVLHGLTICPDLDTVAYTLAGLSDQERGWGIEGDTFNAMRWLGRYGWSRTLAVSIAVPVVTYLMFEKWFLVPLPKGPFENWLGL